MLVRLINVLKTSTEVIFEKHYVLLEIIPDNLLWVDDIVYKPSNLLQAAFLSMLSLWLIPSYKGGKWFELSSARNHDLKLYQHLFSWLFQSLWFVFHLFPHNAFWTAFTRRVQPAFENLSNAHLKLFGKHDRGITEKLWSCWKIIILRYLAQDCKNLISP